MKKHSQVRSILTSNACTANLSACLHTGQNKHAPEMSATLRLRYSDICCSVILEVKGVETSAMFAAIATVVR